MRRRKYSIVFITVLMVMVNGCELFRGPKQTGEIVLSSQMYGTDSYYLFGYSYEKEDYFRYPYQGEPVPDIINEGIRVLEGGVVKVLPGFNTPGLTNGFVLLETFQGLDQARNFYKAYTEVPDGLQYEIVSDTVELYQVWVQKTSMGKYVKLLIKDIQDYEGETGAKYNEVTMEYTYQPDGTKTFPD